MKTVAELIAKLQEFDGDMPVLVGVNGVEREIFDADVDELADEPVVLLDLVWED